MRLLLIEDNRRLANRLATALQNGGFAVDHVTTTADPDSALAAIHYDALVLDLGSSNDDGLVWLGRQRHCQLDWSSYKRLCQLRIGSINRRLTAHLLDQRYWNLGQVDNLCGNRA
jgi:hypothetical protein